MKKAAAAEDLSAKKELALQVIDRLKTEYPDAACTLDYDHAWQLLVSVRLAAQCTDARVNIVVQDLFAKYPNVAALAAAEPEEIEAIVKPCGLGRSKARDISACMRVLRDKYNCKAVSYTHLGLGEFKVGPRHRRKLHILGFIVADDGLQALHTFDLGGVQVFQKCGHGKPHQTFFVDRGGLIPIAAKLIFQRDGHKARGVALLFHQLHRARCV